MRGLDRRAFVMRAGGALAVAASGPLLAACGDDSSGGKKSGSADTLEALRKVGVARVGIPVSAPYSFANEAGEITGIGVETTRAVLKEIGVPKLEPVIVDYASLIPGLVSRRFDLLGGNLYITAERCKAAIFSDPDMCFFESLLVKSGNPLGLNDYEDVANNDEARLGVVTASAEEITAAKAGIPGSRTQKYPDYPSAVDALEAGRSDAIAWESIGNAYLLKGGKFPSLEEGEPFVPEVDGKKEQPCGGYVFRKGDQSFRDAFNVALRELRESGELFKLTEEFGTRELNYESAKTHTANERCGADYR
jgi:polar amino acid transport system substrate-binding protein